MKCGHERITFYSLFFSHSYILEEAWGAEEDEEEKEVSTTILKPSVFDAAYFTDHSSFNGDFCAFLTVFFPTSTSVSWFLVRIAWTQTIQILSFLTAPLLKSFKHPSLQPELHTLEAHLNSSTFMEPLSHMYTFFSLVIHHHPFPITVLTASIHLDFPSQCFSGTNGLQSHLEGLLGPTLSFWFSRSRTENVHVHQDPR